MTAKDNDALREEKKALLLKSLRGKINTGTEFFKNKALEKKPVEKLCELLDHTEIVTIPEGSVLVRRITIDPDNEEQTRGYKLDKNVFNENISSQEMALLSNDDSFGDIKMSDLLFVDTETTGLAGGTGTYPFLSSVGFFEENKFIVEQFFAPDYPDEYAQMKMIADRAAGFKALATYNGKTFDIPLLTARFIYNRMRPMWHTMPNWDLLFPARRLWKNRLADCSLSNIEREVLNIQRKHDIAGGLIPQIYFNYLRGDGLEVMQLVFDHNAQDIISLADLALRFVRYLRNPEDDEARYASEQFGLFRIFSEHDINDKAVSCLENAILYSKEIDFTKRLLLELARFNKKNENWEYALDIWMKQMKENPDIANLEHFIESAKYFEHKVKDYEKAYEIVSSAEKIIAIAGEMKMYGLTYEEELPAKVHANIEDIARRSERLKKKIEKRNKKTDSKN